MDKEDHYETKLEASTKRRKKSRGGKKYWKPYKSFLLNLLLFPIRFPYNIARKLSFFKRCIVFFTLMGVICGLIGMALWAVIYIPRAMLLDMDHVAEMPARSLVFASDRRTELGRLHGDNRYVVGYEDVSPHFVKALLAQEDAKFNSHIGIDFIGLFKIPIYFLKYKKVLGASTITMQLARNSYPLSSGVDRKLLEIAVALRIEKNYKKDEILEHYMNRIFLGHSMYGIEAACRAYFEKSASEITLSEAAMLAGIIRGPNIFSPFKNMERALNERDRALDRMVTTGFISLKQADVAKKEVIYITPSNRRSIKENYVMATVKDDLKIILEKNNIKMGNLKVYTTIDHRLQSAAQRHLESHLKSVERSSGYKHQTRSQWLNSSSKNRKAPGYLQGSLVCIENKTGAVRSLLGGRSAFESTLNRATEDPNKRKQMGSIIKPFVFLTALDKGMSERIPDTPINNWPHNSDDKYYKEVSINKALSESRNCATVHAGIFAGKDAISRTLYIAGYKNYEVGDASFFLGAGCATPWEVASSYSIFPNKGLRFRPHIISEIRDQNGNVLYSAAGNSGIPYHQASLPRSTQKIKYALDQVTKTGTAKAIKSVYKFKEPCGGKTGTSSNGKDAWFAGYTESLTCAVWVGFDNPKNITKYGAGSNLAMPIWVKIMQLASSLDYPMHPRAMPVK